MNMSFKCGLLDMLDIVMKYRQVCTSTLHEISETSKSETFPKAHPSEPTEIPTLKLV